MHQGRDQSCPCGVHRFKGHSQFLLFCLARGMGAKIAELEGKAFVGFDEEAFFNDLADLKLVLDTSEESD